MFNTITTGRSSSLMGSGRDSLLERLSDLAKDTKTILCKPKKLTVYSIVKKTDDEVKCFVLDPNHSSIMDVTNGYYSGKKDGIKRWGIIKTLSLLKAGFSEADVKEVKRMGFFLQYQDRETLRHLIVDDAALASLSEILGVTLKPGVNSARDLFLASVLKDASSFLMTVRVMGNCGRILLVHKESARPTPLQAVCELFGSFPLPVEKWEISSSKIYVYLQCPDKSVKIGDDEVGFGMRFEVSERNKECIAIQNIIYFRGQIVWFSKRLHQIASLETSVSRLCDKYLESEYGSLDDALNVIDKAAAIHVPDVNGIIEKLLGYLNLKKEFGNSNLRKLENRRNFSADGSTLADALMSVVMLPSATDGTFKAYAIKKLREQVSSLLHPDAFQKMLKSLDI